MNAASQPRPAAQAPVRVVFRADASVQIGVGHVMRGLSLAAALRALGGESHFVCRAHDGHVGDLIKAQGHRVHLLPKLTLFDDIRLGADWSADAEQTMQEVAALRPDWLVVDHYGIDARWERRAGTAARRQLVIDDLADREHDADLLLDQNLQPAPARYSSRLPARCRTLLGPRFALLRPEFAARRDRQVSRSGKLRRVLATAGGVDQTDLMSRVVHAWSGLPDGNRPALALVVGRDSPNLDALRELCAHHRDCTLHVQTDRMADLMAESDLMITAAGSVNWERCCLGLPALLCASAGNQFDNLVQLARCRTAISIGPAASIDAASLREWLKRLALRPRLLERMSRRAAALVDGHGAYRVAVVMNGARLALRPATPADAELAWRWRNDEATRRHSIESGPIALDQHVAWWRASLANDHRSLLIAHIGVAAVGVLRLDHDGPAATVSIYLDPRLTRLGLGQRMLQEGHAWVQGHRPGTQRLNAVIRTENHASARAFAAAGYCYQPGDGLWVCDLDAIADQARQRADDHDPN